MIKVKARTESNVGGVPRLLVALSNITGLLSIQVMVFRGVQNAFLRETQVGIV